MDEMLLRQEMKTYKIKKLTIKEVLQLANLFMVPYQAMAKRLKEIGVIGGEELKRLLLESNASIEQYKKKYALSSPKADNSIAMDNLAELSVSAFESDLITYEKLEYLLELCGLRPEELGIRKVSGSKFPSDEELDSIMEEEL